MKSETLTQILENGFKAKLVAADPNFKYLQNATKELKVRGLKPYSYSEFIKTIKQSKFYPLFQTLCNEIRLEYIYKSSIHGIYHNERVAMFALFLAEKLNLAEIDAKIAIYAALYHDIGRQNDDIDDMHGTRSAKMVDKLNLPLDAESLKILKTAMTYHCLDDRKFYQNLDSFSTDRERTITAFNILKDADGLDRVRLGGSFLSMKYLRTQYALKLVPIAIQLEYNYRKLGINDKIIKY